MKRSALASVEQAPNEVRARHLRPVEEERRGAKFAALDHDVARVLGPQRGAAVLYGFLASTWFEFADPQKLADRKQRIKPGDWVEVNYRQFMEISGTNAKASIIRWLRILAEDTHACPWSRCGDEHPLIVVQRQGQSRPNRYRKWRCAEDTLVVRRRVRSQKLSEAAKRRVAAGQRLNGIPESAPTVADTNVPDAQLALLKAHCPDLGPEVLPQDFREVSPQDGLKSTHKTSESLAPELPEVSPPNSRESHHETSLREKTLNTDSVGLILGTAAEKDRKDRVAAFEETNDVDAVACEIVEAILTLALRVESAYSDDQAWAVARRLAAVVLEVTGGEAARARGMLQRAITDRRLARASNPVGLLIRGVVGDRNGADRYLLGGSPATPPAERVDPPTAYDTSTGLPPGMHAALLDALRAGRAINDTWLRERDIPRRALAIARAELEAESRDESADTPLAERLAAQDPTAYRERLEQILTTLELPALLRVERTLDHPMLLGMCRARLEAELMTQMQGEGKDRENP